MNEQNLNNQENSFNNVSADQMLQNSENQIYNGGQPYPDASIAGGASGTPTEMSYQSISYDPRATQFHQNLPQPKKSKKGLFVGIAAVLLLLITIGTLYAAGVFRSKTNFEKIIEANIKTGEITEAEAFTAVRIEDIKGGDSSFEKIADLIEDISLELNTKFDKPNKKVDLKYAFAYKGINILDLYLKQQGQAYLLKIPALLSKEVFFSKSGLAMVLKDTLGGNPNSIEANIDNYSMENFDKAIQYYKPAINPKDLKTFKKLDKKGYVKRALEFFNSKITVEKGSQTIKVNGEDQEFKGDVYTFDSNLGDLAEFYIYFVTDLIKDENFKPFVEEYVDRFIAVAEKNQDVYVHNYIANLFDLELKTSWDDDVKQNLIYWKQSILEKINEAATELEQPSAEDKLAKAIKAIKESDSSLTLVYVIDKIILANDFKLKMDLMQIEKNIAELDKEIIPDGSVFNVTIRAKSAILKTGKDVVIEDIDKSKAIDYANATDEVMIDLWNELFRNAYQIVQKLNLF